jgi:hypothetical protein
VNERRFLLDTQQHRDNAARYVGRLDVQKPVELILRPYLAQRTSKANARLWALHAKAAEVTGYSAEEMHELMLKRFFGVKEIKVGAVVLAVPLKRSSMRNKKEFNEFMESTEAFYISELGVWLE